MALQIFDVREGQIDNKELNYQELIDYIDEGYIHIPEFQRKFVWTKRKILELLDSIYRGYPIGSLIFWVTEHPFDYSSPIGHPEKDSFINARLFVIDGQQRLKSLYHAAKSKKLKMKREQSNKSVTKKIDVLFDLENERFVFREDLVRNKRRTMFPIPEIKDIDLLFNTLRSINSDDAEKMREQYGIPKKSFNRYIWSLQKLGMITDNSEGKYTLTELGKQVVKREDSERIASILADNAHFIMETLQIIKNNPGITRKEAAPKFQEYYGKSKHTSYYQFGRRCRWLRALKLIEKKNGSYFIADLGSRFLKDLILTEKSKLLEPSLWRRF